jgi:uncharacterized membrane protein
LNIDSTKIHKTLAYNRLDYSIPMTSGYSVQRSSRVDAWRGSACLLMIFYHGCYDLTYLNIVTFDFYHHPFWLSLRILIVSLFVSIVGVSLFLATIDGVHARTVVKRVVILLSCALLISLVSFILFQERFIFFGILHFITLASVLGLLFRTYFRLNIILGTVLLIMGITVQHPLFNQPFWQWIGLMTYKPATEDYVPFIPWFGVVLLGIALGHRLYRQGYLYNLPSSIWEKRLATVGQHSLLIYMLHQPLLLGGLLVLKKLHYNIIN